MNRGYFRASRELLQSDESIKQEIQRHFQEVHRKEVENGIIEIHGYSELFTIKPIEGASQQYDLWFETDEQGIARIKQVNPIL